MKSTYQERLNEIVDQYNKGLISSAEAFDKVVDLREHMIKRLEVINEECPFPGTFRISIVGLYSRLAIEAIQRFN